MSSDQQQSQDNIHISYPFTNIMSATFVSQLRPDYEI